MPEPGSRRFSKSHAVLKVLFCGFGVVLLAPYEKRRHTYWKPLLVCFSGFKSSFGSRFWRCRFSRVVATFGRFAVMPVCMPDLKYAELHIPGMYMPGIKVSYLFLFFVPLVHISCAVLCFLLADSQDVYLVLQSFRYYFFSPVWRLGSYIHPAVVCFYLAPQQAVLHVS